MQKAPETVEEINRYLQLLIAESIYLIEQDRSREVLQLLQYANNLLTKKSRVLTTNRLEFLSTNIHFFNHAARFLRNTKAIAPLSTIDNHLLDSDQEGSDSDQEQSDGKQEKEEGGNNNNSSSKKSCNIL